MAHVADAYKDYGTMELPALTLRQVGSPWNTVVRWFGVGATIPNEVIKRY